MKPQPAPPGAVQELLTLYRQGYEAKFQEPPVILKRDGPILRSLINQFGLDKVKARLRAFLQWDDEFVVNSGYALTMFHTCWNRLAARCIQTRPDGGREMSAERTAEYLRNLKATAARR